MSCSMNLCCKYNSANIIFVSFYKLIDESNYDFVPLADFSLSCNEPRPVWTLFNFLNNYPWSNYAWFINAVYRCRNSFLQNENSLSIGKDICLHIYNIRNIAGLKKLHHYITTVLLFFPPHSKTLIFNYIFIVCLWRQ